MYTGKSQPSAHKIAWISFLCNLEYCWVILWLYALTSTTKINPQDVPAAFQVHSNWDLPGKKYITTFYKQVNRVKPKILVKFQLTVLSLLGFYSDIQMAEIFYMWPPQSVVPRTAWLLNCTHFSTQKPLKRFCKSGWFSSTAGSSQYPNFPSFSNSYQAASHFPTEECDSC